MFGRTPKTAPQFKEGYQLPSFLKDDALALNASTAGNTVALESSEKSFKADRGVFRKKCAVLVAICVLLTLVSICFSFSGASSSSLKVYAPWDVLGNLVMWAAYHVSNALGLGLFPSETTLIQVAPLWPQVVPRCGMTLATLVCGALLACAGMLYQVVFRNPIASPSLLGVTHGVQVGFLLVYASYGLLAESTILVSERFVYGYAAGIATLLVVFALAKLITKRGSAVSVFDILVVGTIISALFGAFREYLMDELSALNLWASFFEYQEGLNLYDDPLTYAVLAGSVVVAFVPIFLLRFRLNLLSFTDGEVRIMGSNPQALRFLSLAAGSFMILTAQVFVGSASCFALVIPFLARFLFGSEFRKQLWGNVLLGMIILLVCRDLTVLIPFPGTGVPIGAIAGAVTLPVFVWASALSHKGW